MLVASSARRDRHTALEHLHGVRIVSDDPIEVGHPRTFPIPAGDFPSTKSRALKTIEDHLKFRKRPFFKPRPNLSAPLVGELPTLR